MSSSSPSMRYLCTLPTSYMWEYRGDTPYITARRGGRLTRARELLPVIPSLFSEATAVYGSWIRDRARIQQEQANPKSDWWHPERRRDQEKPTTSQTLLPPRMGRHQGFHGASLLGWNMTGRAAEQWRKNSIRGWPSQKRPDGLCALPGRRGGL